MNILLMLLVLLNLAPIEAATPITEDSQWVVGTAQPGETLRLLILQQPDVDLMTEVDEGGQFRFRVPELTAGHVIIVQGYGAWDISLVEDVGRRVFLPMVGK